METTITSKGQATIPKAARDRLGLKHGDKIKFFFHPDGVIILPKIPTSQLMGMIPKPSEAVTPEQLNAAIEAGATESSRLPEK